MSACSILDLGQGRMSTFGGPEDQGVGLHEGLALISENDVTLSRYAHLFMSVEAAALVIAKRENIPAPAKIGMARRLNPLAFYLAMRWDQALAPFRHVYRNSDNTVNAQTFTILRHGIVRLTNPENGFCLFATPVDYGPGDGRVIDGKPTRDTGRIADLSPGAAKFLLLQTDDIVRCELILPEPEFEYAPLAFGSKGESGAAGILPSGLTAPAGKEAV